MNVINVSVNFAKGICTVYDYIPVDNDYNASKMMFTFDKEYNGRKVLEIRPANSSNKSATFSSEIINNEITLGKLVDDEYHSIFTQPGEHIIEVHLYNDGSKLTAISQKHLLVKEEQILIGDEQATVYLPIFDQMIQQLDSGLTDLDSALTDLQDKLDTDYFKGEKGDKGDPGSIKFNIVQTLPTENIEIDAMYLVPLQAPESQENKFAEYIYVNNQWELLGKIAIHIDLSDYYTKQQVDNLIPTTLSQLTDDTTHRLVSDTEKATWNGKADKTYVDNLVGDISSALDTINGEVI